jgi:hypothetical protein
MRVYNLKSPNGIKRTPLIGILNACFFDEVVGENITNVRRFFRSEIVLFLVVSVKSIESTFLLLLGRVYDLVLKYEAWKRNSKALEILIGKNCKRYCQSTGVLS